MLSHLYIVKSKHGLVKIGRSACPKRRITEIAKATGTKVIERYISPLCLNASKIERYLHKHFAEYRQQGEWFKIDFETAVDEAKKQNFQTEEHRELMPFTFENNELRVIFDEKGEPWFCLKDACTILSIRNSRQVMTRLEANGIILNDTLTKGGKQRLNFINEANFYRVIFQARKKEAIIFQNWVVEDVLPSIRKTGQYSIPTNQQLKGKVEQKTFENFIGDCFIPDSTNKERARDIYLVYQGWCLHNKCEARTIQWVGMQLRKQGYNKSKCPPNRVACWHGFRLNNLACPANPSNLEDLQSYLSALSKNLATGMRYSDAELLSLVNTASQKAMAVQ